MRTTLAFLAVTLAASPFAGAAAVGERPAPLGGAAVDRAPQPLPPARAPQPLPLEPPAPRTPAARLSPATRTLLRQRMAAHGDNMSALVDASLQVDYARVVDSAERIEGQPRFGEPETAELSVTLPRFLELQNELRVRAHNVATAARERRPDKLAAAVSDLSQTCIRCHALYRE